MAAKAQRALACGITPIVCVGETLAEREAGQTEAVVKRLQDELYEFKDASGTINVEIDDEHWPAQAVSETAVVKISGEVDRDLTSREIDVEYLELVK